MIAALKKLFKRELSAGFVLNGNTAYLCLHSNENGKDIIHWIGEVKNINQASNQKQLRLELKKRGAKGAPCNIVLNTYERDFFQIPPPPTQPQEFNQAARWVVKDYLDYPVDEMVVDSFMLNENAEAKSHRHLAVAVSQKKEVLKLQEFIESIGLRTNSVTIPELSLRNLALHIDKGNQSIMTLAPFGSKWLLSIMNGQEIFMLRQLTGFSSSRFTEEGVNLLELELQRSLDFYEVRMSKSPVSKIYIYQDSIHRPVPIGELSKVLGLPVSHISPQNLFEIHSDISFRSEHYLALGGSVGDNLISESKND